MTIAVHRITLLITLDGVGWQANVKLYQNLLVHRSQKRVELLTLESQASLEYVLMETNQTIARQKEEAKTNT